jgi:prepilin-type N-terminal cleavage/methylation domain-containing protein
MRARHGFSLIELVVVVVIVGLLAAVAIPRFGTAAVGASDAALTENLSMVRRAIDLYHAEHGGLYPAATTLEAQLVGYTDDLGTVRSNPSAAAPYGPYLRRLPPYKAGRDVARVAATAGGNADWVYDELTGTIYANASNAKDAAGRRYADY